MIKLPADFCADSFRMPRAGQPSRLGGIRRGAQGVGAHMRNRGGLSCRPGGGHRRGSDPVTHSATADETASDLLRDVKLAAGEPPSPSDGITRPAVTRNF